MSPKIHKRVLQIEKKTDYFHKHLSMTEQFDRVKKSV